MRQLEPAINLKHFFFEFLNPILSLRSIRTLILYISCYFLPVLLFSAAVCAVHFGKVLPFDRTDISCGTPCPLAAPLLLAGKQISFMVPLGVLMDWIVPMPPSDWLNADWSAPGLVWLEINMYCRLVDEASVSWPACRERTNLRFCDFIITLISSSMLGSHGIYLY